ADGASAPTTTMANPRIVASQPTTNSAGAARPSIVNIAAPGRPVAGGEGEPSSTAGGWVGSSGPSAVTWAPSCGARQPSGRTSGDGRGGAFLGVDERPRPSARS